MMRRLLSLILIVLIGIGCYYAWETFIHQSKAKLYFSTSDGMNLAVEERALRGNRVEASLNELIKGPTAKGLTATIPEGVQLLSAKVENGLCTVNFNENLVKNHWGGSSGELLTVYSIVNTVAQFPGVERVQLLIEGQKVETLSGHLMLNESLTPDMELVKY